MVNITIDDKQLQVPEGTTVLRAAQMSGIEIPTLCDHKSLTPYGGCRLCLVEIQGARTLQPSCTLPVSNGMVVRTDTEKVKTARKFVLTLIFSERNHFCPFCQVSGGDCELQNAAYDEDMANWPLQPNWQSYPMDASHKYFILEHNRCILCRRCVRACGELVGNFTLGFEERGANSFLVADLGNPLGESSCISCGVCVQVCPTGALIDRSSAYRGRETQVDSHKTICVGCSIGCGMDALTRNNALVRIEGDWDAPLTGGVLCKVGRYFPMSDEHERIVTPLVRKDGALKAATWDDALQAAVAQLKSAGSSSVAAISTRQPAEVLYAFKQLFSAATSLEEGQFTAPAAALADETGAAFETTLAALDQADGILSIGVDLVEEHEVAGFFVKRAVGRDTARLVVASAEANGLDTIAEVTLKSKSAETDVLKALTAAVVKANELEALAAKTGLSVDTLLAAADILAGAEHPVIVFGKGIKDLSTMKALAEFANISGAALLNVKGGANSLAASQYHMDTPLKLSEKQVVLVDLGDETPSQRLIQRMEKKSFLIVMASYTSQLTAMADVVLPVAAWNEQAGHYLNLDGHLQQAVASLSPSDEVKTNEAVLKDIAARLGISLKEDWKEQLHSRVSTISLVEA